MIDVRAENVRRLLSLILAILLLRFPISVACHTEEFRGPHRGDLRQGASEFWQKNKVVFTYYMMFTGAIHLKVV